MSFLSRSSQVSIDTIIEFALLNPWNENQRAQDIRRFLSEFTSGPDLVFDLFDQQGRFATAVLLDKVRNPSNDACLEILSIRKNASPKLALEHILLLAKGQLPKRFSGVQFGLSQPPSSDLIPIIDYNEFKPIYETFDMIHKAIQNVEVIDFVNIRSATQNDSLLAYNVLCDSFSENLETSIPDLSVWQKRFLARSSSSFYFWHENEEIAAFAHLTIEEASNSTAISSIGVRPLFRTRGIGKKLLQYCLSQSKLNKATTTSLTVATTNSKALDLYLNQGFTIESKAVCYRWPRG